MSDHPVNQSTNRDSVGQSAELRTRLAATITQSCHGVYLDDAVDAADAVISELQLTVLGDGIVVGVIHA